MKICIAGWYFNGELLRTVYLSGYTVTIVAHRDGYTSWPIPVVAAENRGLEFGCYQTYLMNHWDGESDVLFMHDDGDAEEGAFECIDELRHPDKGIDQSFIFRDEYEEFVNQGHHGRAFWCRGSWLKTFKENGGFDPDYSNTGQVEGPTANVGIARFAAQLEKYPRCGWSAIVPGLQMYRRGKSKESYQFKRPTGFRGLMSA